MQLVQTRSAQLACMHTQFTRSTASSPSSDALKRMLPEELETLLEEPNLASGVRANLAFPVPWGFSDGTFGFAWGSTWRDYTRVLRLIQYGEEESPG